MTSTPHHTPLESWHALTTGGIVFVLTEDMVLLGRLGRQRRSDQ